MLKKLVLLAFLFVFLSGLIGSYLIYRGYQARRAERIARLNQQAAEITIRTTEGWNLKQIAEYFEKENLFASEEFINALNAFDETAYPLLKRPANRSLEGYLFPDTYRIPKTATPNDVIKKILDNFVARLKSIGVTDPNQTYNGLTLHEILTLASIIEEESGRDQQERDLIASVFYNRLRIGQALESDATVNFVTGKDTPGASYADLQVDSPYNTYKYPGLPPGPISNPSLSSIQAALKPASSDYFYFLHKQPSGEVEFSRTFDEHKSKRQ